MHTSPDDSPTAGRKPPLRASGKPYKTVNDARSISLLGVGLIAGVVIGAGVALLLAPQSGEDTRAALGRRARRIRHDDGIWDRFGRELRRAASLRRKAANVKRKELERDAAGRKTNVDAAERKPS